MTKKLEGKVALITGAGSVSPDGNSGHQIIHAASCPV